MAFGGRTPTVVACTEEYNGSAWANSGAMITARRSLEGVGTQNAALAISGYTTCTQVEEYDGSTWSSGTAITENQSDGGDAGTQNSVHFTRLD